MSRTTAQNDRPPSYKSNQNLPRSLSSNYDFNSKNLFHVNIADSSNVNTTQIGTNTRQQQPLPPIKSIKQPRPRGFKFNRTFLILPLLAFLVVAIIAAVFGVIFGVLYQPDYSYLVSSNTNATVANTAQNFITTTYTASFKEPTNSFANSETTSTTIKTVTTTTTIVTTTTTTTTTTSTTTTGFDVNSVCGVQPVRPNLSQLRIIKGNEAVLHSWPWTVSIGYIGPKASILHVCGGALINKRTVITATHCVEANSVYSLVGSSVPNNLQYDSVTSMVRLYIGVSTRSTDINEKTTYKAVKILSHPDFDQSSYKNDITIITLDRDVEESSAVGFLCVEQTTQTAPGTKVYAVGWGFTENNWFKATDKLMQVSFPIKTKENCGLSYIPVFQFCAGDQTLGRDTCNGDSGGPLMTFVNDKFVLTGIVSNGDSACTGKGVYTNVAVYYDWIMSNSNY